MKHQTIGQEILLLTNSKFSKNRFCERSAQPGEPSTCNMSEQLEKACWNGLLSDMLPEIINGNSKLFLWEIENHKSFLHINLSSQPFVVENYFSLDPDLFLCDKQMN